MKKTLLSPPRFDENSLTPQDFDELELESEIDLRALKIGGVAHGEAENARFSSLVFEGARLSAVAMRRAHFEDTIFRVCDLAGLDARQVFASRIEIEACRATGILAPESDWRDAVFRDSNLSLAQFRFAKFERARFEDCDLREADFQNADLSGVVFQNCDLSGAQFSFARLQGADFRTSETQKIVVDASALRGLIVSPLQAAQFAAILGLQVRWSEGEIP
ncbi:Pentapeptide repeat-containing protein [Abditibacterium utsteinense]|uniref:Pentapeptide repeat-containing protein n=1 Tax=Abditibacterium utsteinense TaxID=1960156 RepID=A0A2S8SUZ4_9BACT|nr:pentapeptide repeat-containing protein [Abditibacterium utsteinense]PQV64599.1 Pentapeptide repeat-containing protein [Abditibacterium utsteinense]